METTDKKSEDMTLADIRAVLADLAKRQAENDKWLNDWKAREAENEAKRRVENEKWAEEAKTRQAENEAWLIDWKAENRMANKELRANVAGIGISNGMFSENYFFQSLNKTKTFGGIHFDEVVMDVHSIIKLENGKRLEGQYDIVMYNDTAVCIVEIKYRLRPEDVTDAADKYVRTFKKLFPMYEGYKFYLAVGGMTTIEDNVLETAKKLGIGVLKADGGAVVEILDENLKAY